MRKSRDYKETAIEHEQCTVCLAIYIKGEKSCDCPVGSKQHNHKRHTRDGESPDDKMRRYYNRRRNNE